MILLNKPYRVLNQIEVNTAALTHNYNYFATLNPQAKIAPVLKSNAYGHGLIPTATFIDKHLRAPFIAVDSLYEAYQLTKHHIRTPLHILGYTFPENYAVRKRLPFSFSVFDPQTLMALNQYQPGAKIHIKLDTGMCRLGLQPKDLNPFITTLKACPRLRIEGLYSHLSKADTSKRFTQQQIDRFKQMAAVLESAGFHFRYKHIAATAGAQFINDADFNLIRLGIGFYGYSPDQSPSLIPALKLTSHLAQTKTVPANSQIGYGGTATTKSSTNIGILPIGYADGLDRRLSNTGMFIGRISMNMSTIKLAFAADPNQPITLIDPDPESPNSIYHLGQICHTIPYTILTNLNPTIKRIFI